MLDRVKVIYAVVYNTPWPRMTLAVSCCRGGLIKWADLLGPKVVADKLNGWAKQYESEGLSGFFKPCKYLQAAADNNTSLEAGNKSSSKM